MITLNFDTKDSILSEEHLYPIWFALEEALESYKRNFSNCKREDYFNDTQFWYFQNYYENKIHETEKVLNEINEAIKQLDYDRE